LITTERFKQKKILILTGPTCSGKTENSIKVAKEFDLDVIAADSMQIYKKFNIGTGKPSLHQRGLVRHHLIDLIDPNDFFNAWDYMNLSRDLITNLDNIPLIAGGTQLYIGSMLNGLSEGVGTNKEVRDQILMEINQKGSQHVYEQLKKIDIETADKIKPNDKSRIARAMEIYYTRKQKPSEYLKQNPAKPLANVKFKKVGIKFDKEELDLYIKNRTLRMIDDGLIGETESIISEYGLELKPLKSIGYKEIVSYLEKKMTLDDAIKKIIVNTRRLAKRQVTWLRKDSKMEWHDNSDSLMKSIREFLIN
tara:strand:- start:556 stop:1479 length:924 start_codon:yes stop_codon:yes gene_type:complete